MPAFLKHRFANILHQMDYLKGKTGMCFQKASAWISNEHALSEEHCKYPYLHGTH